ncbi:MAG: hypothetical protein H7Z72_20925 [Bacteroidetes bacterium]|nr:hypothetical protein [Fibrella sp.]
MNRLALCSLIALGAILSRSAQAQTKVTVTTSTNASPSPVSSPTFQPDTVRPNRAGMVLPQGDDRPTRLNRKQRRINRTKSSRTDSMAVDSSGRN